MLNQYFKVMTSSIMKKLGMGVTGLLLCGFLVSHLLGNLLIFVGPQAFNTYAHTLVSNPLIYVAEAILLLIFLKHVVLAIMLTVENKMARPVKYYMTQATGRGSTIASSSMPITGLIILIFIILHILQFKFGAYYEETYDGVVMRDLYRLLIEFYQNPLNVAWYIFAMACVAMHVSHGFWSAFQSIGVNHPKYTPLLRCLAKVFALVVFCGFSSLPIYCYLQGVQ